MWQCLCSFLNNKSCNNIDMPFNILTMPTIFAIILLIHLDFTYCFFSFCFWTKCCPDKELIVDGLTINLTKTVFGQKLVVEPILNAVSYHLGQEVPKKALVLSFNGPAGVGKTFVAKKIAHHLFSGQTDHVKFYNGRNDFQDGRNIVEHKTRLNKEIREAVSKCPYAIFIFDECDVMGNGIFDVLKPFTDYYNEYQGIDYRRAIFIFMSNIGGSAISEIYFKKKANKETLNLLDFEHTISSWMYNKDGGFKHSGLLDGFLVDWFVPFLPLDKENINKCIQLALEEQNIQPTHNLIREIYGTLPKKLFEKEEYVPSNCKKISGEVGKYKIKVQRLKRFNDEM